MFADTGGWIGLTAYDKDLNLLWQHAENRLKDYFGHYIYPWDVNGDGVDEVVISHLCLDANGKEVWNNSKYFEDNHDHMDALEFFDMNGDGKPELLVGQSDVGTLEYNAQNGQMIWQNVSDHSQQVTAGYILADSKTPQVVTNGEDLHEWPERAALLVRQPGAAAGEVAGASAGREPELCARRLVRDGQADVLLVPLQAGAGRQRDAVLQGRGVPHVRLRPYRGGPGDHAGGRRRRTGGGGTQTCGFTAMRMWCRIRRPCDAECRKLIANHTHY